MPPRLEASDLQLAYGASVVVAEGTPHEVLTVEMLRTVFDLDAQVVTDPVAGTPMVIPIGRRYRPTRDLPRSA